MKMLQISILDAIEEASISSREDSLANPTQAQESEREKKTNAIYGQKCLEQFEKLNPDGLWAKTFADLLIGMEGWYSTRCKLSWKLKGTKSNRFYFQLQASTRRTEEIESGLLLTPTAVMTDESPEKMRARAEKNGYKNGTKYGSLLSQVKYGMLPTPTAGDGMRGINANTTTFENGRFVRTSQTTGTKFGASLGQAAATSTGPITSSGTPVDITELLSVAESECLNADDTTPWTNILKRDDDRFKLKRYIDFHVAVCTKSQKKKRTFLFTLFWSRLVISNCSFTLPQKYIYIRIYMLNTSSSIKCCQLLMLLFFSTATPTNS